MTPQISSRGRAVPPSPIRKLMPLADAAKKRGVQVYHLNIGQPDLETPLPMRERLKHSAEKVYAYSPSGGTPEYLATLQKYYAGLGIKLGPEELIATTGGSEALLFALFACANEGDEALVVEPFYTNYRTFATLAGVRLQPIVTKGEDGFHLPPRSEWDKAVHAKTKVVILCNPNNPTGTVYTREEIEMVARLCRERGMFLLADEVYREFVYDGREAISTLTLPGYEDLVVAVDSLSKRYSACGIRLGCLATRNRDVYQSCLKMAQGRLSPPGLAQIAALGAVELGPDYFRGIAVEYQKRRDILYQGLCEIPGVFLRKPEGAFYFIARLPVSDSEDFASWLLTDFQLNGRTVMMAPANGFYVTPGLGQDEVRIAYVLKEEDLRDCVRILAAGLREYGKRKE
jgi:aspartate aminotransferase